MDYYPEEQTNERTIWMRGLYMLLFSFFQAVAKFLVLAIAVLQFLFVLFSGSTNPQLVVFGESLSLYTYQIFRFLTFNTEELPYPWNDWPKGEEGN